MEQVVPVKHLFVIYVSHSMWKESESKMYGLYGNSSNFIAIRTNNTQDLWFEVPFSSYSVLSIRPGSSKALELALVDVPLLDKATMLTEYGLQNMDCGPFSNPNLLFGGKILVAGGDFRQCLPFQPRNNCSEALDLSIK